jgi:NADH-quinone oxidoreductase subunit F
LGTAAVVVIDDQTSMVDALYNVCRFMSHESCGQCTPCREGTTWSTKILERVRSGKGKLEDIDLLYEVAASMGIIPGTTICGLSDGAAWPVKNAITKFRGEFEEYIKSGRSSITPAQRMMEHASPTAEMELVQVSAGTYKKG